MWGQRTLNADHDDDDEGVFVTSDRSQSTLGCDVYKSIKDLNIQVTRIFKTVI